MKYKLSLYGIILIFGSFVWITLFSLQERVTAKELSSQLTKIIRDRIEAAEVTPKSVWDLGSISDPAALTRFYERRASRPAWIGDEGLLPQTRYIITVIQESDRQGLRPEDYHLSSIESMLAEWRRARINNISLAPERLADFDLLLTDAFLTCVSHLLYGRVNPESIHSDWLVYERKVDLAELVQSALDSNQMEKALEGLFLPHPGYLRLRRALGRYQKIKNNGGWATVANGPAMQKGDRGARVVTLRTRLIASGDLRPLRRSEGDLFDDAVEQAVRQFQERHGLETDGIVGPSTLAALNVPVQERLNQIILNMERWRWLSHYFGRSYIAVNTANFELKVVENGRTMMTTRAVVGKPSRPTPVVLGAKITHMELNPHWGVPYSIATEDILPKLKKDPGYLTKMNIKIFEFHGNKVLKKDPTTVAWSRLSSRKFPYILRQEPGPLNALGRIKFIFPNKFNVYIHDTPARALFQKTQRDFSSGCIRIENPIQLAEYLLQGDPKWTRAKILTAISKGENQALRLPEPIVVNLLYLTAWVNDDGTIHFRDDIYGRDQVLAQALNGKSLASKRSLTYASIGR
jgi:murein L,D-transpeptidase YcbB/YkuD